MHGSDAIRNRRPVGATSPECLSGLLLPDGVAGRRFVADAAHGIAELFARGAGNLGFLIRGSAVQVCPGPSSRPLPEASSSLTYVTPPIAGTDPGTRTGVRGSVLA